PLRSARDRFVVEVRVVRAREVERSARLRKTEHFVEINSGGALVARPHQVAAALTLFERARAQGCEPPSNVARDEAQKRFLIFGRPRKLAAQRGVLRRDADRTGVLVALPR